MAAMSQNGYSGSPTRQNIHTLTVAGTNIRIPVRVGPAGDLLMWAAARWNREVEPLVEGWNWGWAYREIRGGGALSNHASGTAIDLNAPRHPLGVAASKNLSPAQIATIRRIVADAKGCLVWGGEWSRPDAMHLEVSANEAKCAAVLKTLTTTSPPPKPQEDSLATVPQAQWDKVYRQEAIALDYRKHHGSPEDDQLGHTLSIRQELAETRAAIKALAEKVDALAAKNT